MDKSHASKVDNWLLMAVVTCAVLVLLAATLLALRGLPLFALLLFLLGAVVPMWVVMATRYHIIGDELRVRAGPFRWRIRLEQVIAVTPCHNSALAPAMSRSRLKLVYYSETRRSETRRSQAKLGEFELFISPEDRYQFIFDLGVVNPEVADDENEADENEQGWLQ